MRTLKVLTPVIALLAAFAAYMGIFYETGNGSFDFTTIHNQLVRISGEGLYQFMSADVAIQGVAQDYITLFVAVPVLIIVLFLVINNIKNRGINEFDSANSQRIKLLFAGVVAYFFVTYTFYLSMGAYNQLFLVYATLSGCSFFAFYNAIKLINKDALVARTTNNRIAFPGWVLMVNAVLIALLWLSVVLPPLFDGTIYPLQLEHYTTLIVQGFDLGILLPASFVTGWLFVKRKPDGLLYAPIYLVFLTFLMLALIAKIVGMSLTGVAVGPAIVIIPCVWIVSLFSAIVALKKC